MNLHAGDNIIGGKPTMSAAAPLIKVCTAWAINHQPCIASGRYGRGGKDIGACFPDNGSHTAMRAWKAVAKG